VVPRLAVGCLVDVLEPDGSLKAILATHLHKKTQELLSRAPRLPPSELDPECGIARALASGTANVLPMSADSQMVGRALGIADPAVLAALWPMAILCVPLLVGERFTGVLSLFQTEYKSADDLEGTLIEELARRIAIAIDNARLYADAQRAIRTREDVLAIASHDLRGPLSSILLSSEVLLKAVSGPALARLELLRRSALHMRRMLDCMLSAATIEAGHLVLARSRSSVAELVREAISMFTDLAATKRLTLSFTPPAEPIELTCDHDRIVEVLANLVQNSINYTPEGGAIGVQAESSSEEVRLAVTDTGAGIPPEVLPLVFDRYRRAPGAQPRGTGLGLFIAKGIVEAHHGRIAIESMPGVGTTVSFTLPRLAAP
jgi:signal transduction histidine kinase